MANAKDADQISFIRVHKIYKTNKKQIILHTILIATLRNTISMNIFNDRCTKMETDYRPTPSIISYSYSTVLYLFKETYTLRTYKHLFFYDTFLKIFYLHH